MFNEILIRQDLAAVFRLLVSFNWHESVGNHLSAKISEKDEAFIMNRKWMHFSEVTASNLQRLSAKHSEIMQTPEAPDASAWCVHASIHCARPDANVILHCHSPYATTLACLSDPTLYPIDNNTGRFFGRVAYDMNFGGIADAIEEGERIASVIGDRSVLIMQNHGVTIVGETVAMAFEDLYFFEKAAQTLLMAYQSNRKINVLSDEVAEHTAQGWQSYAGMADAHFSALKQQLSQTQPDYQY